MRLLLLILCSLVLPASVHADELNAGDTAWMLTATALVLFMTLPGLALFYGGLVRAKNVLSVLMQCFVSACAMTLVWIGWGYSLALMPPGWKAARPICIRSSVGHRSCF